MLESDAGENKTICRAVVKCQGEPDADEGVFLAMVTWACVRKLRYARGIKSVKQGTNHL